MKTKNKSEDVLIVKMLEATATKFDATNILDDWYERITKKEAQHLVKHYGFLFIPKKLDKKEVVVEMKERDVEIEGEAYNAYVLVWKKKEENGIK